MRAYKVLVTHEVLSLRKPSARDRQAIISYLESLSSNPCQSGDYEEKDEIGRPVHIKVIGQYALTSWVDHAVSEVKVTQIEKADRE